LSDDPTARILAAIDQLRGDVNALRGDMTILRGEVGTLRDDLSALREEMTDRTNRLRADMDRLRVDVMERMDRLQNGFTLIKEEITVSDVANDRVERMVRNATDETRALAEQVTAMGRQIRLLSARIDDIERGGNGQAKRT
jgi:chromosome segregation ATPase